MRRVNYMENFVQDVRHGLRMLGRNHGFAAVAILTLALGIGANTALFGVLDTVLLRPLPYRDPSRLVWATERFAFSPGTSAVVSPDFVAWKDRNQVFEQIGAFGGGVGANLTAAGQPARVSVTNITAELFPMLGVQPLLGRTFLAAEGKQGEDHVALLNETLWRSRFSADPHILGKTIRLDGAAYVVVGIMPANVRYPGADVWTPFALDAESFSPRSPRWSILTVLARLRPGAEIGRAQSDLQFITEQMDREYPPQAAPFRAHERVEVIPLHELLVQNVRLLLLILLGAVGFVLLIACANVGNLLLSRSVTRGKEMAVRAALGARRLRLIRQLLTEGLLLAVTGSALGLLAGLSGTKILEQLIPSNLPSDIHLDLRILAFCAATGVLAVFVFALVPALIASRTQVSDALKEGGLQAGASPAVHRMRSLMAVGEIALSLTLLVGAGLLARSFLRLSQVELGFDPHGLLLASVDRPLTIGFDSQQHAAFFYSALERIRSLPGVKDAALTTHYPLEPFHNATVMVNVKDGGNVRLPQPISITAVSADYFRVMRIRLLKGRVFGENDVVGTQGVVIMNEPLAKAVFKGRDPLGQHISFGPPPAPWLAVAGVVSGARNNGLEREPGPEIFVPYLQQPSFSMTFVLRTESQPEMLAGVVREAVESVDANQPLSAAEGMDKVIGNSVAPRRFQMMLLGLFALLASVLAAIGIYGVIICSCSQRTQEFGIRIALGAGRQDVLSMVLRQGIKLALIGVSLGIAGALALTRLLSSLLYGVKPTDPLTFFVVSLVLTVVALIASYIPARRATKVDPMVALRYE
jgi:predicted permease